MSNALRKPTQPIETPTPAGARPLSTVPHDADHSIAPVSLIERFTSFTGFFHLALSNLHNNKLRSSLTILGMVFGSGAVIATLSSSEGASRHIQEELKKQGINTLAVLNQDPSISFTDGDRELVQKYSNLFQSINFTSASNVEARVGPVVGSFNVLGINAPFLIATKQTLRSGRFFDSVDEASVEPVAVLGFHVKEQLFGKNYAINEPVTLFIGESPVPLRVVGTLQEKGGASGAGIDNAIFLPLTVMERLFPGARSQLTMNASLFDENLTTIGKRQLQALLKTKFLDSLRISDAREEIERNKEIWEKQNLAGLALAFISLLTGGVGIMNVMLLSVAQRRKEIGLRKALGATQFDILLQFLLEAGVICLVGGVLGVLVGILLGQQIASLMGNWKAVVSVNAALLSLVVSLLTGLAFGLLPAHRASQLDPYEALRT